MNEDKIVKKLLEHDDRFDQVDQQIKNLDDKVNTRLDQILTIVQRLDQERLFTFELYKRLEKDMERVKKILKIA